MRVQHAGDVVRSRAEYATRRGANLRFLLRKRIRWMQPYVTDDTIAVELGCGAGFTKFFLRGARLELTDVEARPWVDRVVDALAMPYGDASVDVLIANNVVHHLARPPLFFAEAARVLRPGGHLLLQECDCSLTTRLAIRLSGHEAYDFTSDPFDPAKVCSDPADPWSANCAIPNLLFDDIAHFERAFPAFRVLEQRRSEFFVFFNSGGIVGRAPYLPLPWVALRVLDIVDAALVRAAPGIFASQRRIVLQRA